MATIDCIGDRRADGWVTGGVIDSTRLSIIIGSCGAFQRGGRIKGKLEVLPSSLIEQVAHRCEQALVADPPRSITTGERNRRRPSQQVRLPPVEIDTGETRAHFALHIVILCCPLALTLISLERSCPHPIVTARECAL